jgi:hypothetical protein
VKEAEAKVFKVSLSEAQVVKLVPQLVEECVRSSRSSEKKVKGLGFCFLKFSKVRVRVRKRKQEGVL